MKSEQIYKRKLTGIEYKIIHETSDEYCFFRVVGLGFITIKKSQLNDEFQVN